MLNKYMATSYQGKYTNIQGTFIKSTVTTPEPEASFSVGKVLITTNESPLKELQNNFTGWLNSTQQVLEFFDKNSKVYEMVDTFFNQKNQRNPRLNNAFVGISYVDIADATNAYVITNNLNERLANFAPKENEKQLKGQIAVKSGRSNDYKIATLSFTKKPTIEELAIKLNQATDQSYFEVINYDEGIKFYINQIHETVTEYQINYIRSTDDVPSEGYTFSFNTENTDTANVVTFNTAPTADELMTAINNVNNTVVASNAQTITTNFQAYSYDNNTEIDTVYTKDALPVDSYGEVATYDKQGRFLKNITASAGGFMPKYNNVTFENIDCEFPSVGGFITTPSETDNSFFSKKINTNILQNTSWRMNFRVSKIRESSGNEILFDLTKNSNAKYSIKIFENTDGILYTTLSPITYEGLTLQVSDEPLNIGDIYDIMILCEFQDNKYNFTTSIKTSQQGAYETVDTGILAHPFGDIEPDIDKPNIYFGKDNEGVYDYNKSYKIYIQPERYKIINIADNENGNTIEDFPVYRLNSSKSFILNQESCTLTAKDKSVFIARYFWNFISNFQVEVTPTTGILSVISFNLNGTKVVLNYTNTLDIQETLNFFKEYLNNNYNEQLLSYIEDDNTLAIAIKSSDVEINNGVFSNSLKDDDDMYNKNTITQLIKQELKISTLYNGSYGTLAFKKLIPNDKYVDLADEDYLGLLNAVVVPGQDSRNNEESQDYFATIVNKLAEYNKINTRTLMTTCALTVNDKIAINHELEQLYADTNNEKCCKFCTHLNCIDEVKDFSEAFNSQPLYVATRTANWTEDKSRLLDATYCASMVSHDIVKMERYDPEWNNIDIDVTKIYLQKGYNNTECNKLTSNYYSDVVTFNGEGIGLVVHASQHGWSSAMHTTHLQVVNQIPISVYNTISGSKLKSKSSTVSSFILSDLNYFGNQLFNNNFISNEPLEDDPLYKQLSEKRQNEIKEMGWSVYIPPINSIKGNVIPIDIAICLGGVIASCSIQYSFMKNYK